MVRLIGPDLRRPFTRFDELTIEGCWEHAGRREIFGSRALLFSVVLWREIKFHSELQRGHAGRCWLYFVPCSAAAGKRGILEVIKFVNVVLWHRCCTATVARILRSQRLPEMRIVEGKHEASFLDLGRLILVHVRKHARNYLIRVESRDDWFHKHGSTETPSLLRVPCRYHPGPQPPKICADRIMDASAR